MTRMVHCVKLNHELEGLERPPYPGEIGQRIYDEISKQAWQQWLEHQTLIINEKHLSMVDPQARKLLAEEMQKFLFEGGTDKPEGYVAPES
ncbi:MAG TPA: oxidative damage protection protein [Gammaproteobacteria bacterium]|nr:oxidative damage protection protein [Gammaproteobacteria bacterium]